LLVRRHARLPEKLDSWAVLPSPYRHGESLHSRGIGFRSLQASMIRLYASREAVLSRHRRAAEFERDLIRERTQAGLQSARPVASSVAPLSCDERKPVKPKPCCRPSNTVRDVCATLGIFRATPYRHTKAGRNDSHKVSTLRSAPNLQNCERQRSDWVYDKSLAKAYPATSNRLAARTAFYDVLRLRKSLESKTSLSDCFIRSKILLPSLSDWLAQLLSEKPKRSSFTRAKRAVCLLRSYQTLRTPRHRRFHASTRFPSEAADAYLAAKHPHGTHSLWKLDGTKRTSRIIMPRNMPTKNRSRSGLFFAHIGFFLVPPATTLYRRYPVNRKGHEKQGLGKPRWIWLFGSSGDSAALRRILALSSGAKRWKRLEASDGT